jgi:transcriptional regulator with XRE-family HTH domain
MVKHDNSVNEEFRKTMALARWSAAETARRLGVSESSISAYINDNQVPPQAKISLLRLLVDQFINNPTEDEQNKSSLNESNPARGPARPSAAAKKKSLREIRLDALYIRIETLAGGLRFFENAAERVEAAEELAALATELAVKLQTPGAPKAPK